MQKARKAALLLTGVGKADGSETIEAVSMILALHKQNIQVKAFAFNRPLIESINHLTSEKETSSRNAMTESARIMRGEVNDMSTLDAIDFDMLLVPGGFGVAKNFCDFAFKGQEMTVDEKIQEVLTSFHFQKKPIGACCIAPILIAKVIPNAKVTLGMKTKDFPFAGSIDAAESWGAQCELKDIGEICVDKKNKLVTSPAFMKDAENWYPVMEGNERLVQELVNLI